MRLHMTQEAPCWVRLNGAVGKLEACVRQGIRPTTRRKYDHMSGTWLVHWHWTGWVAKLAREQGYIVDWKELPDRWQMVAAGASPAPGSEFLAVQPPKEATPFDALYVVPTAPDEVIKAAYKAMASKTHPDKGGDAAEFRKVSEAYDKILKMRGS